MKSLLESVFLVVSMLLLGSGNTMVVKLMFQTESVGQDGREHLFNKPWLSNLGMFAGEASLLFMFHLQTRCCRSRRSRANRPTIPAGVPPYVFAVPACCDVTGTGIAAVGMVLIDAAAWQMMRGSIIIFSTFFSVFFLRRQLKKYHYVGVLITSVALMIIGLAAILEDSGRSAGQSGFKGSAALGISLVIFAQVFSAFQNVFEEYLLTDYEVSSLQTVGMEGIWGCVLMTGLLTTLTTVPGSDHGVYESLPDGLHMIGSSHMLQLLLVANLLLVSNYNIVGMQVCRKMSAVTRCLVDSMRTVIVWALQLILFYGVSPKFGHPWTEYSWLQVCGFLLLTFGTLVYNAIVELPGLDYGKGIFEIGKFEVPKKAVQTYQTPTMNRACLWNSDSKFGPHSPCSPQSSPLQSPFASPSPFESNFGGDAYIILEEEVR